MSRYGKSKVWYADGNSRNGRDQDIPKTGVICVVQWIAGARRILQGKDYYWLEGEEWVGGDYPGMIMYLMQPGKKEVFFGAFVNSHVFAGIMTAAHEDPEFPQVSVE